MRRRADLRIGSLQAGWRVGPIGRSAFCFRSESAPPWSDPVWGKGLAGGEARRGHFLPPGMLAKMAGAEGKRERTEIRLFHKAVVMVAKSGPLREASFGGDEGRVLLARRGIVHICSSTLWSTFYRCWSSRHKLPERAGGQVFHLASVQRDGQVERPAAPEFRTDRK